MDATVQVAAQPQSHTRVLVHFFAPVILLSAFLLFWCEPMAGKMLLPLLGGAASVWLTCLLFFQLMLVAGYGYVHLLERYANIRTQILLHTMFMLAAVLFLPIQFEAPDQSVSAHPVLWLLGMLLRSLGLPFGILSTTAPLLQNWLSKTRTANANDPYFLYAISNAGSLLALVAYPLWIEPGWGVRAQGASWFAGYGLLFLLMLAAAAMVWIYLPPPSSSPRRHTDAVKSTAWSDRLFWLCAAFVPSGLMLAVTNHMLLNLASVPLLWVVPLAAYLLTFMIAFARRLSFSLRIVSAAVPIVLLVLFPLVAVSRPVGSQTIWYVLGSHVLVLIAGALLCHTALASQRPNTSQLTEFYFWIALGGALGGLFVAVVAPLIFDTVIEYPLLVALIPLFRITRSERQGFMWTDCVYPAAVGLMIGATWYLFHWASVDILQDLKTALSFNAVLALVAFAAQKRHIRFALTLAVMIAGYRLAIPGFFDDYQILNLSRNFFGTKKVVYDLDSNARKLLHGDTLHGLESSDPARSGQPLSYYHETGPVGDVMNLIGRRPDQEVAVVGVGTGTMAGWARPDRHITFFDIDPQVPDIATRFFTYLRRCGSRCDIVIGDGRLSIERAPDGAFDLIMLDAFNSDSIPAHLVSREAVDAYVQKLKPHGLILFHVSNRYMDVEGLVSSVALDAGLQGLIRYDDDEDAPGKTSSDYVVAARSLEDLEELNLNAFWAAMEEPEGIEPWTDDYSNMMAIIRWR